MMTQNDQTTTSTTPILDSPRQSPIPIEIDSSYVGNIMSNIGSILKVLLHSISSLMNHKDSQAILEGIYRTQLIKCLMEVLR